MDNLSTSISSDPFNPGFDSNNNNINGNYHSSPNNNMYMHKKGKNKSWFKNPFILVGVTIVVIAILYFGYIKWSNNNNGNLIDPKMQGVMQDLMMRDQMLKQKEYQLAMIQRQIGNQGGGMGQGLYFNQGNNQMDPGLAQQLRNNPAMAQQMLPCQPISVRGDQPGVNEYDSLLSQREMEYGGPTSKLGGYNQQHSLQPQPYSPQIPQAMPMGTHGGVGSSSMGSMGNMQGDKLTSLFIEPKP